MKLTQALVLKLKDKPTCHEFVWWVDIDTDFVVQLLNNLRLAGYVQLIASVRDFKENHDEFDAKLLKLKSYINGMLIENETPPTFKETQLEDIVRIDIRLKN